MGFRPVAIDNANEKAWAAALLNILWLFRTLGDIAYIKLSLRHDNFFFPALYVLMNALALVTDSGWGWLGALMR